jgi:hypothetical protein
MNDQDKIAEQAAEIANLNLVLAERKAKIAELMGEAARAGMAGAAVLVAGELPEDVRYALDRMCLPLDASYLSGVTAAEDARCMAVIKEYIERSAAPAAPLPELTGPSEAHLTRFAQMIVRLNVSEGLTPAQLAFVHGMAYAALASPSPAPAPQQEPGPSFVAVDAYDANDGVDGQHPSYGRGVFFTLNCMKTLYESVEPAAPGASIGDAQ